MDNNKHHESPAKSPSRQASPPGSSQTDLSPSEKDFLKSHDLKVGTTWLQEERYDLMMSLNDLEHWEQIMIEFNKAELMVSHSKVQSKMLESWEAALSFEPESVQVQRDVELIHEEVKNVKVTIRELRADLKRLTKTTVTNDGPVPHGLIDGLKVLLAEFHQSAVALDMIIQRGIDALISQEAPIFQAFHKYYKVQESYYQVASIAYLGTDSARSNLKCTRLQAVIQEVSAVLALLEQAPPTIQKHMKPLFTSRLSEFKLLLTRAEANRLPLTLKGFIELEGK